jgi:HAD superfamily hydrolase (TIGR01509 family)
MNSSNNQTRAVLWDLDGTLIDSMPYHWEAWNAVLRPLGYHFSVESFKPTIGLRNEEIVRDFLKLDRPLTEIEQMVLAKEARYRSILRERGLPLLPGGEHWLAVLRADGWRHAIVTSAPRLNVEATVFATHLDQLVETIVCAEDVIHGKPDPEPFLLAADRLGVPPARCIVVEDAPAGLAGARRAGMKSIGVLTTHAALEANCVVRSLVDLAEDVFDKVMRNW